MFLEEYEEEEITQLKGPLKEGRYIHCLFFNCVFDHENFSDYQFIDCRFQDCLFNVVNIERTKLQNTEFAECKLIGIDFPLTYPLIFTPKFSNSSIISCIFSHMHIKGISFKQSRLNDCYFQDTKLHNCNFCECDFEGTIFQQCDLTGSNFNEAKNYQIDPQLNTLNKCKFSTPEVLSLLDFFKIKIDT